MAPVGVAIIGGGIFVKSQHLPAVMQCDALALKAIYSRSLKSAEDTAALYSKPDSPPDLYSADSGAGKTYHDLLLRDDIAGVIIALPIVNQPEYIEAALSAGKHVLAEKPIGPDVAAAQKLIAFYERVSAENKATLAIAENCRFWPSFEYAAAEARKLGAVKQFNVKVLSLMPPDAKWLGTAWRQKPEYQGGFLLDGGVHQAALLRLLLGGDAKPDQVRAFTSLQQEYLPPIDSLDAIIKTKNGASGSFQLSSGSLLNSFLWEFALENGTVVVNGDTVTVKPKDGEAVVKEFERTSGVASEVAAWGEALVTGKPNLLQSPVEALRDLELMEMIFKSGDQDGAAFKYELQ